MDINLTVTVGGQLNVCEAMLQNLHRQFEAWALAEGWSQQDLDAKVDVGAPREGEYINEALEHVSYVWISGYLHHATTIKVAA